MATASAPNDSDVSMSPADEPMVTSSSASTACAVDTARSNEGEVERLPPPDFTKFDAKTLQQIVANLRRKPGKLGEEVELLLKDLPTASSSSTGPSGNKSSANGTTSSATGSTSSSKQPNHGTTAKTTEELEKEAAALQYQEIKYGDGEVNDDALMADADSATINDQEMSFLDRSKFVPIRLSYNERPYLRLIEGATAVSSYTDKVDGVPVDPNNPRLAMKRTTIMMKQMCALLSGILVSQAYEKGQQLLKTREFAEYRDFFRAVFEIGRRYKILNPERMREAYGKMMYVMQDSNSKDISELLGFSCVQEVRTVWDVLSQHPSGIKLLSDPLLHQATMEIRDRGRSRREVEKDLRTKQNAKKSLQSKYATSTRRVAPRYGYFRGYDVQGDDTSTIGYHGNSESLDEDTIEQCVASLGDHSTYLRFNREPCDRLLEYLKEFFSPADPGDDPKLTLSIAEGQHGARLSHTHERQYRFVLQSLLLWREVLAHMFQLWHYAEHDLLDPDHPYTLTSTGQGLHRVQPCQRVQAAMSRILEKVQKQVGVWIGSNQIHLGDHNVPNALMFIDKYAQVPRICQPIVLCLDKIPKLYSEVGEHNKGLIDSFGGVKRLQKLILADFFRHAFDGSGGDNFFDAGSCVDGRLTSAWNWCSQIERKPYFPVFLLTGFVGFDGEDGWDK